MSYRQFPACGAHTCNIVFLLKITMSLLSLGGYRPNVLVLRSVSQKDPCSLYGGTCYKHSTLIRQC